LGWLGGAVLQGPVWDARKAKTLPAYQTRRKRTVQEQHAGRRQDARRDRQPLPLAAAEAAHHEAARQRAADDGAVRVGEAHLGQHLADADAAALLAPARGQNDLG
jgi:hypothetical protein